MKRLFALLTIISLVITGMTASAQTTFSSEQKKEIEKIVHNYLVQNPEVLLESSQSLRTKMAKKAEDDAILGVQKNAKKLFEDPNSPVVGNPKANIVVVEFFDYQCPHCRDMREIMDALVKQNPNMKVIYKEFPIFGDQSLYASKAALAAMRQNKYKEVHGALLSGPLPLTKENILAIVRGAGLNMDRFQKDMESRGLTKEIVQNTNLAKSMNLVGTPAYVVANIQNKDYRFMGGAGSQEELQALIDDVNKKANQ